LLYKIIREILPPNVAIVEEFVHPFIKFSQTGHPMNFDIFVPAMNLAFEYHGCQHYHYHPLFGDVTTRQQRDNERREACKFMGLACIEVPYWWQFDKEGIMAILHNHRADIVLYSPK